VVVHSKTCKKQSEASGKCVCGWKDLDPIILERCPFCGKTAVITTSYTTPTETTLEPRKYHTVGCADFSCRGHANYGVPEEKLREESARWNRRA